MEKPLVSFRVYPERRTLFAQVNIWPTKKAMYTHQPLQGTHEACCAAQRAWIIYRKKGKKLARKTGLFAELNFYKGQLGVEVTSHEFTHAMFCFADRLGMDLNSTFAAKGWEVVEDGSDRRELSSEDIEERCCYALGEMYRQFVNKCYAVGLY